MTEQTWDFNTIAHSSEGVRGSVVTTQGLLADGDSALKMLAGVWGGASSAAYQQMQNKWNQASEELNLALNDLAVKIAEAGSSMGSTESGIESTFMV